MESEAYDDSRVQSDLVNDSSISLQRDEFAISDMIPGFTTLDDVRAYPEMSAVRARLIAREIVGYIDSRGIQTV